MDVIVKEVVIRGLHGKPQRIVCSTLTEADVANNKAIDAMRSAERADRREDVTWLVHVAPRMPWKQHRRGGFRTRKSAARIRRQYLQDYYRERSSR